MIEERRRILDMLAEGKITVDEAEALLAAVATSPAGKVEAASRTDEPAPSAKARPKYIRVVVEPREGGGKQERVNIRVPLQLFHAGVKLSALIPREAREKVNQALSKRGIDVDLENLTSQVLEELIDSLSELSVDVEDEDHKVRIFCE